MLPYPVLHERKGDFVAHVKFTVLLMPNGTLQVSGLPPATYNALVASGTVSSEGVQSMNGNIGKILFQQYQLENPDAKLPENIEAILNEVKPENKKKAKKAAKAAAVVA
jgi:ABC-type polar amino acid transport system ATPase subunit